jgi:thiosulfate reductase cytochrome b subunit
MFFFLPFLILSGILYMFPLYFKGIIDSLGGMKVIAAVHTSLAYFTVAFFIVHVYLTTTGATILSEIKSMFSGFKEEETEEKMETHPEQS